MSLNPKHTDDTLRKIGRNVVNFQKLEQALKALVRLSSSTGSQSRPLPVFPRQTKRLKRAGLAEAASQFNRVLYTEASPPETPPASTEVRISHTFSLQLDSNAEEQRKELAALARERNHLVHTDLYAIDFSSESACLELCDRLDSQNHRILGYLEFVRSIRDTHSMALKALLAYVESNEFLQDLASDETDA
jgi:hypothetical protein